VGIPLLVAEDARPGRGPLEGLAAGLRAVAAGGQFADNDAVYATGCDVPLLVPAFVTVLRDRLGDDDVAVPYDGQYHHPLSAIYRIRVLANIDELLSAEELRPTALFDVVPTARVPVDELRTADPQLRTLENLNHPADYLAALAAAGYAPPPGFIERPGGASDTERRRTE
jgi:molybdopterin-guanine dinucleotide biosynthesis protein A